MIVERIYARNFMRFQEVALTDIPATGSIAIVGENESGKSAIGEIVSFALFGETPRARRETAFRVVRWGSDLARVELGFSVPGMGRYKVERELDADGLASARLLSAEGGEILAESPSAVDREIRNLLGFHGDEFRFSFYLAQNELDIVDGSRDAGAREVIFKMLGIDVLERIATDTRRDLFESTDVYRETKHRLALTEGLLENFEYDPDATIRLEKTLGELELEHDRLSEAAEEIRDQLRRHRDCQECHQTTFAALDRLRDNCLRHAFRRRLRTDMEAVGGMYRGLRDEQSTRELALERTERELKQAQEREKGLKNFRDGWLTLKNMVNLQLERRRSDLAEEPGVEGTSLQSLVTSKEEDLKKRRFAFFLGLGQATLAVFLLVIFLAALHSVTSGQEYLPFLKGALKDDLRGVLAGVASAVFGAFAVLLVVKVLLQRKGLTRKADAVDRARAQLKTAQVERDALERIDFQNAKTVREAQPHIAEKDIREMIRTIGDSSGDFMDAGIDPDLELDRAIQSRLAAERERRQLEADINQRQALLEYAERRVKTLFEGVAWLEEVWMNASPIRADADLDALEERTYETFDLVQNVRNAFMRAGGNPNASAGDADPRKDLEGARSLLEELTNLLTETMGYQGSYSVARFESCLEKKDWDSPDTHGSRLEEEIARLKTAFPSEDEIRKKIRKLQDDAERAVGKRLGLESRLETTRREVDCLAPRHEKYQKLTAEQEDLSRRVAPLEHDMAVRKCLIELVEGTADNIKNRLGPEIGRFIGRTISEVTKNRYGNASVSENLEVQIFSREKNGLITLDEVSGGTRDQVLLCLRLALSQALVRARMGIDRGQFLFLDEPVSSFDEERSLKFLDLVRTFSPSFQQIFVTLHIVGAAPRTYEKVVRTALEKTSLVLSLA